jgi:hypothetical protein
LWGFFVPDDLPTVDLKGVEIFAEGSWNGDKYTASDLQEMIHAFDKVGFEPTVKAGHADGQDNLQEREYRKIFGAPALGYVSKIYRNGTKLLADLKQVPRQFANLIKAGTYRRVSSEIYWNYKDEAEGKTYPRVLKSIAFLGAEIPAITNLKAIEALFHKNESGSVYAYEGGREFRMYEMDEVAMPPDGVTEKDGKWCAYKDGKLLGEFASKEEALAAMNGTMNDGDKGKYSKTGEREMTEQEIQAKLDALRAELTKDYEAKTATAVTDAVAKAKAEADAEKSAMADRIAELEKKNQETTELARYARIDARLGNLKKDGKITPVEETQLRSVLRALPEVATHSYSNDKGEEVKESVVETVWKLFEGRNSTLLKELADQGREIKTYSDAQSELIRRANDLIAKDQTLTMTKAFSQIAKEDPELWRKYQLDVKGSH